jgi:deoxyuridine 5'-triphosphate nucleotidohydrolase
MPCYRQGVQPTPLDLYSCQDATIKAPERLLVDTDISVSLPLGTYGRVAPRSGLSSKHKLDVGAGVVDQDYRGPVRVLLINQSDVDFEVHEGDRIAQLIVEEMRFTEIQQVDELDETMRASGGFGATGL